MTALTCESCDPLLVELALDELDDATASAVREHAEGCDACSRALARLTTGRRAARDLVRVDAPDLSAVLAAARARAREVREARVSEPGPAAAVAPVEITEPPPPRGSFVDEALRWLGAWAARPQVAMGTLFVLMVGIGLWYVPQFRWRSAGDPDGTMVEPDTTAELAPSTEVQRRERLALDEPPTLRLAPEPGRDHDLRPTTAIAPSTPAGTEATRTEVAHTRVLETERVAPAPADQELAVADVVSGEALGRVEEGPLPEVRAHSTETAIALAPSTTIAPTTAPLAPAEERGSYAGAPVAPAPSVAPAPPRPTTVTPHAETSPTPSPMARSSVDRDGLDTPAPATLLPNAIHRQARSLASAGQCSDAIPRYEALLRDHADYADAPRAMLELADCLRRVGRLDAAATWIARAERFPSVSADARRARVQLESQAEASRRASSSEATSTEP